MHITESKKPSWEGYTLYDSNYMMLWKRRNYGNNIKTSDGQELGDRGG